MTLSEKRILVVDDQDIARSVVKKSLEELGITQIVEASDGSEALRQLDKNRFDVILCDIRMEPLGGIEFVKTLRNSVNIRFDFPKANTPVIFLTASDAPEDIINATKLHVHGYLLKPLNSAALENRLSRLFGLNKS